MHINFHMPKAGAFSTPPKQKRRFQLFDPGRGQVDARPTVAGKTLLSLSSSLDSTFKPSLSHSKPIFLTFSLRDLAFLVSLSIEELVLDEAVVLVDEHGHVIAEAREESADPGGEETWSSRGTIL